MPDVRRILVEREMRASPVIVREVAVQRDRAGQTVSGVLEAEGLTISRLEASPADRV
jgi:hypothetical protein